MPRGRAVTSTDRTTRRWAARPASSRASRTAVCSGVSWLSRAPPGKPRCHPDGSTPPDAAAAPRGRRRVTGRAAAARPSRIGPSSGRRRRIPPIRPRRPAPIQDMQAKPPGTPGYSGVIRVIGSASPHLSAHSLRIRLSGLVTSPNKPNKPNRYRKLRSEQT
ncbi:NUDIX hydrolase domain protein [Mycobacterium kansasii]|uniref:NUDIX hydrolase domain protein n=1 Tax=Mycobacterium kansasii TaxID=1768 RepID=A0A1V3WRG6_MYCKA|nr:NUDIX hydrolase domain protein [Mycobacterium kansasii]